MSKTHHIIGLIRAVGLFSTINILVRRLIRIKGSLKVKSKGRNIEIRATDSDFFVASQIFGWEEYDVGRERREALNKLAKQRRSEGLRPVIIDGGANVGYSSLYFAELYPEAIVIAVEPLDSAFEMLERNCAGNERIVPVHAALWSHDNGVELRPSEDLGSWAATVANGGVTRSCRLETLLGEIPGASLLILKLDVEGAEREICDASPDIVGAAPCVIIEPHDFMLPGGGALSGLYKAISGRNIDTILHGENLMLFDSGLLSSSRC